MTNAPTTGDDGVDAQLRSLLDELGPDGNRDLLFDVMVSAVKLSAEVNDRLDLKITSGVLREMREAFHAFGAYKAIGKVTIFGSARTRPEDPTYVLARDVAAALAGQGWMVVTGAGPGIMAAGMEGAGRAHSFGVNIRLPHEQGANEFIEGDTKLVSMKYFFTRKLMLMKESSGFISLPGGFGTLDETFELLTLLQTGKGEPAPVVLLDRPGGTYWTRLVDYMTDELVPAGLINPEDLDLFTVTDSVSAAVGDVLGYRRNFITSRWVGDRLVLRLRARPTEPEVADLAARFGSIALDGAIEAIEATSAEVRSDDLVTAPRLALRYNGFDAGRLRRLIDAVNELPSAAHLPALAHGRY